MEETTVTQSTDVSDNSPAEPSIEEQVSSVLNSEPDTNDDTNTADVQADNAENEDNISGCPDKFKNKDGSVNIDKLAKSYKELEPLLNEKAAWEKQKAELLQAKQELDAIRQQEEQNQRQLAAQNGYNSVADMQHAQAVAQFEANEYAKYLDYVDEDSRYEVENKLYEYSQNPSQSLMQEIELEFAPEINKRIAVMSDRVQQDYARQMQKQAQTQALTNIEGIIQNSVNENPELFNYEPFSKLFVDTLDKYGDRFTFDDSKTLMKTMSAMKDLFRKEFEKEYGIARENDEATDRLASISGANSAPLANSTIDINKLSDKELANLVKKLI